MAQFPSDTEADGIWTLKQQRRAVLGSDWPEPPIPTDPDFSSVNLLLHGDGVDGSTTFTDSSNNNTIITANGDVQVDTAVKKFGTGSIQFDGTGDYLSYPLTTTEKFESADWTFEFWVNIPDTAFYCIYSTRNGNNRTGPVFDISNRQIAIVLSNDGSNWQVNTITTLAGGQVPANEWSHVAITRDGTNIRVFIDGVLQYTRTFSGAVYQTTSTANIGRDLGFLTADLNGYLDDIRITKGVARYTTNFTPPTAPFPDQ